MRRGRTILSVVLLTSLALPSQSLAQSFEDELMIETETAIADSEAAMQEAKEAEKIANEEKRRSKVEVTKAQRELELARQEEAKAKRDIARAEHERARAIEEMDKARLEAEAAKQKTLMAKDEVTKVSMQLDDTRAEKQRVEEERKLAEQAYAEVKKEVEDMKKRLEEAKREELLAVKSLARAETGLKDLQDKATISFKNADQDRSAFLQAVASHRETLRKISKKLDELEIQVETDKSFYDKQRRTRLTRTLGSTVSSTNTKVAKVMTDGCNIRNFPSLNSDVVGKFAQGQKLKVRKHNKGWYSVVHDGQKAFMGAGCFQ